MEINKNTLNKLSCCQNLSYDQIKTIIDLTWSVHHVQSILFANEYTLDSKTIAKIYKHAKERWKNLTCKIRALLASNPKTPKAILQELANDKSVWVRVFLAKNPKCSPDILVKLLRDEDWQVRVEAITHKNMTKTALLAWLPQEQDQIIKQIIQDRLQQ